jgi:23S rRNA (adenine2503-C2)-methyltransferase
VERFQAELIRKGIDAFVRKSRGRDIGAACGQLGNSSRNPVASSQGKTLKKWSKKK